MGATHQETFTVTADRRSLAAARFIAPHNLPALRVVDISASAGDCRVDAEQGGVCDFTDLAANGSVTVNVTWEADQAGEPCDVTVGVSTTGDIAANNDAVRGRVTTHGLTDLDLRVGTLSPGFRNATLTFPEITVVNGADTRVRRATRGHAARAGGAGERLGVECDLQRHHGIALRLQRARRRQHLHREHRGARK